MVHWIILPRVAALHKDMKISVRLGKYEYGKVLYNNHAWLSAAAFTTHPQGGGRRSFLHSSYVTEWPLVERTTAEYRLPCLIGCSCDENPLFVITCTPEESPSGIDDGAQPVIETLQRCTWEGERFVALLSTNPFRSSLEPMPYSRWTFPILPIAYIYWLTFLSVPLSTFGFNMMSSILANGRKAKQTSR